MTPYADRGYFLIVLAIVLPMMIAGARGRAGKGWILLATAVMLLVQYDETIEVLPGRVIWELLALVLCGVYFFAVVKMPLCGWLPRKSGLLIPLGLLPLVAAKYVPVLAPGFHFGFVGLSYVTFRALDVLWGLTDGVLAEVGLLDFLVFLFFFPTISSGPIDRFRRFRDEWRLRRGAEEFWRDMDEGVQFVFRGLLYKFVIAHLVGDHLVSHAKKVPGLLGVVEYAYSYSALLFFDFAGYSAFAVGVSRWFGVHTPENFNKPFVAQNIRDFWNRWHMSLSFWFRDHVYTRFLLAALKGRWFKKRETAGKVGYFVSFGLMGVWHGLTWYYLLYGIYHAVLFNILDAFTRWRKQHPLRFTARPWKWAAQLITIHCVIFGFWIFSGHGFVSEPAPTPEEPENVATDDHGQ
ncbi:MAG TPA: D-alanyl-lipoteichoic acid biosynthesis protein DltB [Verrucomicrobiaceae bacterium]|jgi:membrane protein involved in D-alanine export